MLLYAAGNKTDLHCTFKTNDTANVMDIIKLLCSINGTSSYNNLKLVVIIYTHKICLNSAATIKAQNQLKFCINYIILPCKMAAIDSLKHTLVWANPSNR